MAASATNGGRDFLNELKNAIRSCVATLEDPIATQQSTEGVIARIRHVERQIERARGHVFSVATAAALLETTGRLLSEANDILGEELGAHGGQTEGYSAPKVSEGKGAPKYNISRGQILFLQNTGMTAVDMAKALGVSRRTLTRRLGVFGLTQSQRRTTISDADLKDAVISSAGGNNLLGPNSIRARLQATGINVTRQRVRDAVVDSNPVGAAMRAMSHRLVRREYRVPGPNSLWHIDGNHKLIRWRFVIHAGIDGCSRLLTFIKASDNNTAETVLQLFLVAISQFGMPSRIRIDEGIENNHIHLFMNMMRGTERGSSIRGASVHNQRIERAWVDVWAGCSNVFYDLFQYLEYQNLLDITDEIHMFALHYIFIPRINRELAKFQQQWNRHGLSTEHGKSPLQLFALRALQNRDSSSRAVQELFSENFEEPTSAFSSDILRLLDGRASVHVPGTICPLSPQELQQLKGQVNPLAECTDHGIALYQDVVQHLTRDRARNRLRN